MQIPDCPFEMKTDLVCAEFLTHESYLDLAHVADKENLPGDFVVIGKGPGLADKDGKVTPPDVQIGDILIFQGQNAHLFKRDDLPDRKFAMLRAGTVLATVKPDMVKRTNILGLS